MPGPGLWRGQRGMLDFREAMTADRAQPSFRKQHRGGRQVREFRFWAAIKDMDQQILANEDSKGQKRPVPSGEDAIAAAGWDDGDDVWATPARKRRRTSTGTDEEAIELLEEMAKQDKEILSKEEDEGLPQASNEALVNVKFEDETWENDKWGNSHSWWQDADSWPCNDRGSQWQNSGRSWLQPNSAWHHDDRGANNNAQWQKNITGWWWGNDTGARGGRVQGSTATTDNWKRMKPATGGSMGWGLVGAGNRSKIDEEEKEKRTKRSERFRIAIKENAEDVDATLVPVAADPAPTDPSLASHVAVTATDLTAAKEEEHAPADEPHAGG